MTTMQQTNKLNNKMTKQIFKDTLKTFAFMFFMLAIISCNSNNRTETKDSSVANSVKETIPDTAIQFLINSAAADFRNHHPPTAIDFRDIKIGYTTSSNNEKIFVLCGEFLSKEEKEWVEFTTIKTSGYEQYLGKTLYCQNAKIVLMDKALSDELKSKLAE
jgi:hypothetical protein